MNTRIIERKIEVMNYTLLYQKPETLEQLTTVQGNSGFSFNNFANFGGLWSWLFVTLANSGCFRYHIRLDQFTLTET